MSDSSKATGDRGEELAAAYLETKGYTILEKNYFFQRAEVDLVAWEDSCIVFVEVKYRSSTTFGHPDESVGQKKMANIYRAAEAWIYERKMEGSPVRFDVISIVQKGEQAPDIRHYENAFQ